MKYLMLMAILLSGCEVEVPQKTIDDIKSDLVTAEELEIIIQDEVSIQVEEIQLMLDECIKREIP